MTEKQKERLKLKIKKIKAALAADKKKHGGFYDDSRGLRYMPPFYYIKLEDYAGGKRYFNWFARTFPDDFGFPDFLFEKAIVLFKLGKLKEAKELVFMSYCRNSHILNKFFGLPIETAGDASYWSNIATPEYLSDFPYSADDAFLMDFSMWLNAFVKSDEFESLRIEHDAKKGKRSS